MKPWPSVEWSSAGLPPRDQVRPPSRDTATASGPVPHFDVPGEVHTATR